MLTAREILQTEFRHALRGYNTKDVDAFVSRVVKAYETLAKRNKELEDEVAALQDALKEDERQTVRRNELMQRAQETAETIKQEAEAEAKLILEQAEQQAADMVRQAQVRVQRIEARLHNLLAQEKSVRSSLRDMLESTLALLDSTEDEMAVPTDALSSVHEAASARADGPEETNASAEIESDDWVDDTQADDETSVTP